MSDERTLRLLEAFSGVEEDLLERCESAVKQEHATLQEDTKQDKQGKIVAFAEKWKKSFKKSGWQYGSAAAAVLCVAIVGLASLGGLQVNINDSAACEAVKENATGGAGVSVETAAQEPAMSLGVYSATADIAEATGTTGQTNGSIENDTDGATSASDISDKLISVESEEGMFVANTEKAASEDRLVSDSKKFNYVAVSEAEARAHESFGSYVPTELPDGYVLEGAYVSGEGEVAGLMVSWSRGMDSIMVSITAPEELPATVDVNKTETYDEYRYEIPHAETVPAEYWEVFNHPVCAWEDFSLDFVGKRMISRGEDAGDTGTPRGNFSVLYPDGVLVYFNGRGTAEEIWKLFHSMNVGK